MEVVYSDKKNFFSFYKNTSYNLIPLITSDERRVFIITGPGTEGTVIIGNDYLLKFNTKNKFKKKEKIHNSMLQFPYKSKDPKDTLSSTYHSHVLSDCISSTDICTLLLYKDFVEWKQQYVVSKKYVSIFDLRREILVILTRKAWDRINKDQEEREKSKKQ